MNIIDSISTLKGVGDQRQKVLNENGITSIHDLLYYFPRRHLDRTTITCIKDFQKGALVSFVAQVKTFSERPIRKGKIFQVIVSDGTGFLTLSWFHSIAFLKKKFQVGKNLAIHGKVDWYNGFTITHPEIDFLEDEENFLKSGEIIPLYPLTNELKSSGIEQRFLRTIVKNILNEPVEIYDFFSESFLKLNKLVSLQEALKNIHFSKNNEELINAIKRLKFDEHFFLQLLLAFKKKRFQSKKTKPLTDIGPYFRVIIDQLEFNLTTSQKKVVKEIHFDLKQKYQMNRLIQGDVGCGKTIVAILVASIAVGNNTQVAIMAPTEILARQHYQSFKKQLEKINIPCGLLIGNMKKSERNPLLKGLLNGNLPIIIGTHALIQDDIKFKNLRVVIVDEQHRFGVNQRSLLVKKGISPHFLAMTATPIPRTLSITYHGDMDISIIDEMPLNRIPVKTKVVNSERMGRVYDFIRKECLETKQCIIVFPLIEESEKSDLAAAIEAHAKLGKVIFPDLEIGLVHGKMSSIEKELVINKFSKNKINILVSTTVIEVGIDIPNATVILIEHAERFGLTQLHQLRGRVGRGIFQSYCILVRRNVTETSRKRLKILEETNNGFKVADEDLLLRGPGEFFGIKQSGFFQFKIANMVTDNEIIQSARGIAIKIIEDDPFLEKRKNKLIKEEFFFFFSSKLEDLNIS